MRRPSALPALARSASSRMIAADWPPSSRCAGLSSAPQMDAIHRPCLVGPENDTVSTPGWRASAPSAAHQSLLGPVVQARLLEAVGPASPATRTPESLPDELTPREAE